MFSGKAALSCIEDLRHHVLRCSAISVANITSAGLFQAEMACQKNWMEQRTRNFLGYKAALRGIILPNAIEPSSTNYLHLTNSHLRRSKAW